MPELKLRGPREVLTRHVVPEISGVRGGSPGVCSVHSTLSLSPRGKLSSGDVFAGARAGTQSGGSKAQNFRRALQLSRRLQLQRAADVSLPVGTTFAWE